MCSGGEQTGRLVHLMPLWLLWGRERPSSGGRRTTKNRQDSRRDVLSATAAHRWQDNAGGRRGHLVRPLPAAPAWRPLDWRPSCWADTARLHSGTSVTHTEERVKATNTPCGPGKHERPKDKYSAIIKKMHLFNRRLAAPPTRSEPFMNVCSGC